MYLPQQMERKMDLHPNPKLLSGVTSSCFPPLSQGLCMWATVARIITAGIFKPVSTLFGCMYDHVCSVCVHECTYMQTGSLSCLSLFLHTTSLIFFYTYFSCHIGDHFDKTSIGFNIKTRHLENWLGPWRPPCLAASIFHQEGDLKNWIRLKGSQSSDFWEISASAGSELCSFCSLCKEIPQIPEMNTCAGDKHRWFHTQPDVHTERLWCLVLCVHKFCSRALVWSLTLSKTGNCLRKREA